MRLQVPIRWFWAIACLLAAATTPARAQIGPQVLADACASDDPDVLALFDATAYLLNNTSQHLTKNPDGTYAISPIGTYTNSPYGPLDPTSAYYGVQQVPAGRSGVLIAPKTILTSAHAMPFSYTAFTYIFGLHAQKVGTDCTYPDLLHIPSENVYFASTGSNNQYNGVVLNTYTGAPGEGDFVVVTLNRAVTGHAPLAVRKSGVAAPQDRFAGVYFSERIMPVKGDLAIQHVNEGSPTGVQIGNVSILGGSSGGAIYNLDAHVVETVAATSNSCLEFYPQPSGLYLLESNCPGGFYAINGPVTTISLLPGFSDFDLIFRSAFDH
ncbi:MAG TPA: hypothetical protein VF132_06065 [Rudaea sp.]